MCEVVVVDNDCHSAARCDVADVAVPTVSVARPAGGVEPAIELDGALRHVVGKVCQQVLQPFRVPSFVGVEIDRDIPYCGELRAMQEQTVEHEDCVRGDVHDLLACGVGRFVERSDENAAGAPAERDQ